MPWTLAPTPRPRDSADSRSIAAKKRKTHCGGSDGTASTHSSEDDASTDCGEPPDATEARAFDVPHEEAQRFVDFVGGPARLGRLLGALSLPGPQAHPGGIESSKDSPIVA